MDRSIDAGSRDCNRKPRKKDGSHSASEHRTGGDRRRQAAEGIRLLGTDVVTRCVRPLLACLDDEFLPVRTAAAWTLLGATALPEEILPVLMTGLLSERADQRAWCCSLIGETGTTHPGVRRTLELLAEGDPDEDVRWRAAIAVRELEGVEMRVH